MNLDDAVRLTALCSGLALMQSSAEHVWGTTQYRRLFAARLSLAALLATGLAPLLATAGLLMTGVMILQRFDGPYNGGSDRMSLLLLLCLLAVQLAPTLRFQELALGYLACQVLLSYVMSGWVKIRNPAWRNGRALRDVFEFSTYPASEGLRGWAAWPRLLWAMSWAVMLFELLMPITFLNATAFGVALMVAVLFHLANAWMFGLNRFLWIWLAAYPALWWFQARVI